MIDILGWAATFFTLASFITKKMRTLRVLNMVGAALWVFYGVQLSNQPMIFLNSIIVVVHLYWMLRN